MKEIQENQAKRLLKDIQELPPGRVERWEEGHRIIERLGDMLNRGAKGKERSKTIAKWLDERAEETMPPHDGALSKLEQIRRIRNDVVHESGNPNGLSERTDDIIRTISKTLCVQLSALGDTVLESVGFYMTRKVRFAEEGKGTTVGDIAGWMIKHDLSNIPAYTESLNGWYWIDIGSMAHYIQEQRGSTREVTDVIFLEHMLGPDKAGGIETVKVVTPESSVDVVYQELSIKKPGVLVGTTGAQDEMPNTILGIVTAYDLIRLG